MSHILTPPEIQTVVRERYGFQGSAESLISYQNQNFRLTVNPGEVYLFKVAFDSESPEFLEAENAALRHLALSGMADHVPQVQMTSRGEDICEFELKGQVFRARLLSYLPGNIMGVQTVRNPEALHDFGKMLGRMDTILLEFQHPALNRTWEWDIARAWTLQKETVHIGDPAMRRLVDYFMLQYETEILPQIPGLRRSVIHNDANEMNLLADDTGQVTGIFDFGDLVYTCTIFELAIALTYVLALSDDLLPAAAKLVAGYHSELPLSEQEVDLLYILVATRICMSHIHASIQHARQPDNDYIMVSQESLYALLNKLVELNPVSIQNMLRRACGMDPLAGKAATISISSARAEYVGPNLSLAYQDHLQIDRGAMQYLYDNTGKTYLDCVNNVTHVGHCHPHIVRAANAQMATLNTNSRYLHAAMVTYAERLAATLPEPLNVCFFVNSGSEANELAIRLARTYTGARDMLVLDHAYHGNTSGVVDLSPYKFNGRGGSGRPDNVWPVPIPDPYRGIYRGGDPGTAKRYADEVRKSLQELESSGRAVAAFFAESISGCGGQVFFPQGYLENAFRHVRDAGGLCVADEVQVGFGRVGSHFWAFEMQDVIPDIVTMGKPMGNGHPLAAVVTTREIAEAFDNGMEYFNTFGGNPVSCAIGHAVLDVIESEELQANALEVGEYHLGGLVDLADRHEIIGDVRGAGLFIGVELVKDRQTLEPAGEEAARIVESMKDRGILLSIDGPLHNVIKIKPPMVFSRQNVDRMISNLTSVLEDLQ